MGIDPTAPSLHVGHLVPLMALFWMYVHGFYAVTLVSIYDYLSFIDVADIDDSLGAQPLALETRLDVQKIEMQCHPT